MKKFKILFCFSLAFAASISAKAQSAANKNTELVVKKAEKPSEINLDTEESIKYVGSEILFQLKKRLHLSSEAEEEKKDTKKKKVALSFFGIKIEKDDGEY